jgi:PadR family transcriptional regulator, regulatory protein PadR
MNTVSDKFAPLRKGLLEFVVLKIIAHDKVYAAEIMQRLEKTDFVAGEGTLYPLLSRLRREALVDYEWVESESGPPRKYYRLTEAGTTQLLALEEYWQQLNQTLEGIGA